MRFWKLGDISMDGLRGTTLILCLASLTMAGCCCVPANNSCCNNVPVTFGCDEGCGDNCGLGGLCALEKLKSCKSGCGEIYVDEWMNERPVDDNCGYDCGGCGSCNQCRPLLKTLKKMWGTPYKANCCGQTDCGCNSCSSGHGGAHYGSPGNSSCDCGVSHGEIHYEQGHTHYEQGHTHYSSPVQPAIPNSTAPAVPLEQVSPPSTTEPTPAPSITPSSARRISPAHQRRSVRQVNYRAR